ncbi:hypothetical protein [Amycolatopsis sp. NPDC050768]|uniref:hypothetical protein n=1 Tax=Amycolatopsis sp. NPDC050768 TaxID=3154839 RepID=UPI0033CD64A3
MNLRKAADKAWDAAAERKNRPDKSTYREKAAAIDTTVAEIIEQLARDYARNPKEKLRKTAKRPGGSAGHLGTEDRPMDVHPEPPPANPPVTRQPAGEPSEPGLPAPAGQGPGPEHPDDEDRGSPHRSHDSTVEEIEWLGDALTDIVLKDIKKAYPGPLPESTKVALADHFWCDLLAHLAHVIDEGLKFFDDIPDRVTKLILESRKEHRRLPLEEIVVKTAVKSVWSLLQPPLTPLAILNGFKKLLPAVRILAVLICKSPERHEAVVTYCIDPLAKSLTEKVKKRLLKTLSNWLPGLMDEAGPAAA